MIGMNANTGRRLTGLPHLYQSIAKILSTALVTRLQRRDFGSELPRLVDAPLNGATIVRLYSATATALMRHEPRLKLTRVGLVAGSAKPGAVDIEIEGTTSDTGEAVKTRAPLNNGTEA